MDLGRLEKQTRHAGLQWPVPYVTSELLAVTTGMDADGMLYWVVRFRNPLLNLLFWFQHTIISDECEPARGPLLIRWHLLRLWGGRAVMLHCFLRSDNSRHFHDHPWGFRTLLLSPYREHVPFDAVLGAPGMLHLGRGYAPDGTRYAGPSGERGGYAKLHRRFSFLHRPAKWLHWVETLQPLTWTLVYHGPRERPWGFITERGWLNAETAYRQHFPCE